MTSPSIFTSESVTEGHPDKLCDQISDAIVERLLRQDRSASVSAECAISSGLVFVAAKIVSSATIDIPDTVREVVRRAGYDRGGFDVRNCTVMTSVTQLPPSRRAFDERRLTAGEIDRVTVTNLTTAFGYACDHNPAMMPAPIWLAHKLARRLSEVRRKRILPYLAADAKAQVAVEFQARRPVRVHCVALAVGQKQAGEPDLDRLRADLMQQVIQPSFADESVRPDGDTLYFLNPDGPVVRSGPGFHSGMTGRKTAVDTYGEYARSSTSALSGKDPARIDRVGNYAARYAAKNLVAAGLARECEVQLSYSIGLAGPVGIHLETFGTGQLPDAQIAERVQRHFDFRLAAIMRQFKLRDLSGRGKPGLYEKLSVFGQVGRPDLKLPWEQTDRQQALRESDPIGRRI